MAPDSMATAVDNGEEPKVTTPEATGMFISLSFNVCVYMYHVLVSKVTLILFS